jgi:hypothetical protein
MARSGSKPIRRPALHGGEIRVFLVNAIEVIKTPIDEVEALAVEAFVRVFTAGAAAITKKATLKAA